MDILIYNPRYKSCLVQIDQSGAEALIVAYLTRHGNFRELFLQNIKPHSFMAMHLVPEYWSQQMHTNILPLLQAPIKLLKTKEGYKELFSLIKKSDDSKDPAKRYYYIGKTVIHAADYDMKAPTMQMQALEKSDGELRLTLDFCQRALDLHRIRLFPEIPEWHKETQDKLRFNNKTLYNLFGYPRIFNALLDDSTYRKAYAFIPQSTVACISNLALIEIQEHSENGDYDYRVDILNQNHDSGLFQVWGKFEEIRETVKEMQTCFNRRLLSPRNEEFFMKSSAAIGYNWAPYHKETNPEGLIEIE